jgi:hypothetical protein
VLLPRSQKPATCPGAEPKESSLYHPILFFFKIGFNTYFPSKTRSYRWSSSFRFSHQNCYEFLFCSVRATNPSVSFSFFWFPSYIVWWGMNLVSAFLLGFYSVNGIFIQIFQLAVMLHEGPSSINFKYWIYLKMFPAESLISKGISVCFEHVCFDHVLPESFWLEAVIIQNWNWIRDHAAISEALCLFCMLCKTLFNSENVFLSRESLFFEGSIHTRLPMRPTYT